MAVVMLVVTLGLLLQGCWCSLPNQGCMDWGIEGDGACCKTCFPGHRMVKKCGPKVIDLCTPCEPGTFTLSLNKFSCDTCSQCGGTLVVRKNCTPTSDTVCGCKEGLTCGDKRCSFCVEMERCPKGQEPTSDGSCKPCPEGTFNDRTHLKCKPWSTGCLKPNQRIVSEGDAFTDIKCVDIPYPVVKPETPDNANISWLLVAPLTACVTVLLIGLVVTKVVRSKKNPKKPIIRPPTDDPQTLVAIECSFHEAEQEQGSSFDSLDSRDSSEMFIKCTKALENLMRPS